MAQEAAQGRLNPDEISEETVAQRLYTAGQPDVDLMIRTSGEMRLSNFLLWQCAYAEFEFPTVLWPDFTVADYDEALAAFGGRERRFGKRLS
jgi:undecaprenyl diphosphate synthase